MTYYEELGVPPAASVEEIREAYKQLARLLHPDTLRDERSRAVAECQMKRLNALYETLTHAERRRAYDQSLHAGGPGLMVISEETGGDFSLKWSWKWWLNKLRGPDGAWIGAGLIVVLMMTWTLADTSTPPGRPTTIEQPVTATLRIESPPAQQTRTAARGNEQMEVQIQQLRRQVEGLSAERGAALAQIGALERRLADALGRLNAAADIAPIAPAPVLVPEAAPAAPRNWSTPSKHDMAGTWYYPVSHTSAAGRGLYPPEYIEAVIREESGYLVGRYRARYRVADRAISPEVIFQFSGKGSANAARLPWLGSGGSRGEVSLKLITQNTIEIAWIASELGQTLGLGSGTAVLVRRHEP